MIPFLAPLALKLAPVKAFLKAIPRWVWYGLAAALVIFLVIRWHNGKVEDAYDKGVKDERAATAAKAKKLKDAADRISASISTALRTKHDEKVRIIYRDADALRVSGPGKAGVSRSCVPAAASGPAKPTGQGMDPMAEVPSGERVDLIGLPFVATVAGAEQCDLNRAEAQSWREWYAKQSEAWKKIGQ